MSSSLDYMAHQPDGAPSAAIPQRVYPTGMWIALGGILMFFTALASAWVVRKGLSTSVTEVPLDIPRLLLTLNTVVLIGSSVALNAARLRLRAGEAPKFQRWWYAATALGLIFLAGQLFAWRIMAREGVYLASNPDASFFYLFTAAHAIHLAAGIAGLLTIALKPLRHLTLETATRVAAMYWHFLTAIWLAIFLLLTFAGH
jgi:cytochrome c oxidase subunit 3